MAELKTRKNDRSVDGFIASLDDERKRRESHTLIALMRDITGYEPAMWGENIVGFGHYLFKYASGRGSRLDADRILAAQAGLLHLCHDRI